MERVGIHVTDVSLFKRCRQWWDFASPLRMNLESNSPNKNLWAGTGVHEALAYYYHPDHFNDTLQPEEGLLQRYQVWYLEAMGRLADATVGQALEEQILNELELGREILRHYALWAPGYDSKSSALGIQRVLGTEVRIEVPLPIVPGVYVYFEGTADAWVLLQDGTPALVEHKTAARIPEPDSLIPDEQYLSYLWGSNVSQAFDSNRPRVVLYNFLRKKAPRYPAPTIDFGLSRNKSIDTTFAAYLWSVHSSGESPENYKDVLYHLWKQETPEGNEFFRRTRIQRTDRALEAFGRRLVDTISEMLDPSVFIYPAPDWFKCKYCSFREPCMMVQEGLPPGPILQANYQKREPRWPDISPEEG
jgi:hypothetical protein